MTPVSLFFFLCFFLYKIGLKVALRDDVTASQTNITYTNCLSDDIVTCLFSLRRTVRQADRKKYRQIDRQTERHDAPQ